MDEPGDHHYQQTETRTENKIPHVLTYRRVLNNENTWTQGGQHYTLGSVGGNRGGKVGGGGWGESALGEIPNVDDGVMDVANHHSTRIPR